MIPEQSILQPEKQEQKWPVQYEIASGMRAVPGRRLVEHVYHGRIFANLMQVNNLICSWGAGPWRVQEDTEYDNKQEKSWR